MVIYIQSNNFDSESLEKYTGVLNFYTGVYIETDRSVPVLLDQRFSQVAQLDRNLL